MWRKGLLVAVAGMAVANMARAEQFHLMIGVDERMWPDQSRVVAPSEAPCCGNNFYDGDRLAGNTPAGPVVEYIGSGTPLFDPNEFGSMSFLFRRGVFPSFGNYYPWQGVDFLGGPLLDLDGDLDNGSRSLVPVFNETAVTIPGTSSYIDLTFDTGAGTVALNNFDATGTNEGGYFINPAIATTVNVMAGTEPDASQTGPINPQYDTRSGTVTAFTGTSGQLVGVYRIENLGYEFWQDTLLAGSGTASTLGTFQFLGFMRGWLVQRHPATGEFPVLTGEGLGDALWPMVDASSIGVTIDTANGLAGGSATILEGVENVDDFTAPGNGGTGPTDLGSYLDQAVIPRVSPYSSSFVYLEAAGFGANNSGDPLYLDTTSYDALLIAQAAPRVDLRDFADFQRCYTGSGPQSLSQECEALDFDFDSDIDLADHAMFAASLQGPN